MMQVFLSHLPALIWMAVLGLAAGNYACSFIFRLPRGLPITADAPYCGHCRTPLQTRDLFPLFSYLWLRGSCRYCGEKIPSAYCWVEVASVMLFSIAYLRLGFSDQTVLILLLGMCLIILTAMEYLTGKIDGKILISAFVFASLLRVLLDGSIFPFAFAGFIGGTIAACCLRMREQKIDRGVVYHLALPSLFCLSLASYEAIGMGILVGVTVVFLQKICLWSKLSRKPIGLLVFSLGILLPLLGLDHSTVTDLARFLG